MKHFDQDLKNLYACCPECGSYDVVVEFIQGYFQVTKCNKCEFNSREQLLF